MIKKPGLLRSTTIVSVWTFLSRILGFLRDSAIAHLFHKDLTDPFYAALRIPNTLRELLAEGALSAAFVPTFTETLEEEGHKEADELAKSLLIVLFVVVTGIVIVGILFSPQLVRLITPGFFDYSPEKAELTVNLTRVMFPYLLFVSMAALLMGALYSLGHFTMPSVSPISLNLTVLISLFACAPFFPPEELIYVAAIGFVLGGFTQLLLQFPPLLSRGFFRSLPARVFNRKLPMIGRLLLPAVFGQAISEINVFVNLYFASKLVSGSITYLYYSMRLIQFPLGMFGVALATASFPIFSRLALLEDKEPIRDAIRKSLKSNLFLTIPSMVGLFVLGKPLIGLLFDHGQFHRDGSLIPTYDCLCYYSSGLIAFASVKVMVSIFYSFKDTITPRRVGVIAITVNILINYFLSPILQYRGLALGTAVASFVNVGTLVFLASRYIGPGWWRGVPGFGLKCFGAAAAMGMLLYLVGLWMPVFDNNLLTDGLVVAVGLTAGCSVYFGISWLVMRDELDATVQKIRRKIFPLPPAKRAEED